MTDEEYRAALAAGTGALGLVPGIGPAVTAGQAIDAGLGAIAPSVQTQTREVLQRRLFNQNGPVENALGVAPEGPADLSTAAQTELAKRRDVQPEMAVRPMNAPSVDIQAAPTLDANSGKTSAPGVGIAGGAGLKKALDTSREAGIRTLEQERELAGQLGMDKAGRTMATADLQEAEAARQQRLAEDQQRIDQEAAAKHEAFLARSTELSDEIGRMKVDPGRLTRNADFGTRFTVGLGAMLGGALQGVNGGPNMALDRLDKMIDRDIHAQEQEMDNKKAQLNARNSLFGQMLQETGDRRLAAQQTRLLLLESAKTKLQADSDRLGIPEIRTNAEMASNAIQQKIDATRTGMAKEAYDLYRQQAAAAAAQQRAAEERAWQRSMDVANLGLKKDELEIKKREADDKVNEQTKALGEKLSDKDLAEGRAAVDSAKRGLAGAKQDEGLPGVGPMADFRAGLRPSGLNALNPVAWGLNSAFGLSDQERVSRGNWDKIKLAYQKQITGSGASEHERDMLSKAFEGAKSPAEQRNAIAQADAYFSRRESTIRAGFDPRAVAMFDQRLNAAQPALPASVRVKR